MTDEVELIEINTSSGGYAATFSSRRRLKQIPVY
jgi:hypothetical protein